MTMNRTRQLKWIAGLLATLVVIALLVMRPTVLDVDVAVVEPGPLMVTIDEDGMTRLRDHATIAAPVPGRLLAGALRAGDDVKRGQVVARIAPAPLDERGRSQAEAALAAAGAARTQAEARARQAEVLLDRAQREQIRAERLGAAGAVSAQAVEVAQAETRMRERDLDAARSAIQSAVQSEIQAREALLGTGRQSSEGIVAVVSPLSGQVLRVIEEHERVLPAGTPLLDVAAPGDVEIEVDVLSTDAARIAPGARMIVHLPDGTDLEANVSRVDPAAFTKVSPLGVEEQRVNVIGRFRERPTGFGDGYRVATSIVLWSAEAVLTIPSSALVPADVEGWGVYVVEDGRARFRPIQTGQRGARLVEVVSGLKAKDTIIQHPDERISDGVRVASR
jgi:HlyD family secretion protein